MFFKTMYYLKERKYMHMHYVDKKYLNSTFYISPPDIRKHITVKKKYLYDDRKKMYWKVLQKTLHRKNVKKNLERENFLLITWKKISKIYQRPLRYKKKYFAPPLFKSDKFCSKILKHIK